MAVVGHSHAKWAFSWHVWHSMSAFRLRVDSRCPAHCFHCSRSSLISPPGIHPWLSGALIVTSDSSVLTARTALQVYRSWISTVSMAISRVLQPRSAHFNCCLERVEGHLFLARIIIGVVGLTGQPSGAVGEFLGRLVVPSP